MTFGLCLHTILDGVALASHVESEALHEHPGTWTLLGFGTFLGIVLHKPLDSLSITSLMLAAGWSAGWRHAVNIRNRKNIANRPAIIQPADQLSAKAGSWSTSKATACGH